MSTAVAAKGTESAEGAALSLHRKIDWTGAFWVASGVPALVLFSIGGIAATVGKGRIIYTSLTLTQQISNAVPGAMRIFVNLLSAGLPIETKVAGAGSK